MAAFFVVSASQRSALFRGADTLWAWERTHGDRATSILINAGSRRLSTVDINRAS